MAVADEHGRYFLRRLPPGVQILRVSALDREPLEARILVPDSGRLELDFGLALKPIAVAGVTGVAGRASAGSTSALPGGRGSPSDPDLRAMEATPGLAEMGLAHDVRAEPPSSAHDPSSTLYVRGATAELKLVLLDGAPVYAPFHLGGLMPAVQPGVLDEARLYVGGAPARYDGGLSHIMELETRPGSRGRFHTSGAVDLLNARARVEGPATGGISYLASARTVHRVGDDPFLETPVPYGYTDALTRVLVDLGNEHTLSATGFFNQEGVELDRARGFDGDAYWGNLAGSVRYRGPLGGHDVGLTAARSRFETRLPVAESFSGEGRGRTFRTRLAADLSRPVGAGKVDYGVSYDRTEIGVRLPGLIGGRMGTLEWRSAVEALGLYGEATVEATPEVEMRFGLRTNVFFPTGATRVSPRFSADWSVSETSTLSIAAGQYYQFTRVPETTLSGRLEEWIEAVGADAAGDGSGGSAASRGPLALAAASHLVMRLDHRPRRDLRLGMEGYFKRFDGTVTASTLRSSGVDLWIDWSDGHWGAWAGYSLGWVWTQNGPTTAAREFSGRQLLSGGLHIPGPSGVLMDLRLSSSSGLPFSAIPSFEPPAEELLQDGEDLEFATPRQTGGLDFRDESLGSYLRVDFKVSHRWSGQLLGRDAEIIPYLRVLNALDRRDALFYQFDGGQDLRPRSLASVPLLPVVGLEWRM